MRKIVPMIEELVRDALSATADARKFDNKFNVSAGKRTRKHMQVVRTAAKEIRIEIQKARKERKAKKNAKDDKMASAN